MSKTNSNLDFGQKTQLRTECSQEIEKLKRKYDLLIEEHEFTYLQQKKALDDFYEKVLRNQSLAEDFRAKFISPSAAQGAARAQTPPIRRTLQSSQQAPMRPSVVGSSSSPSALSAAYRPPVPRPRVQAPQADQPSSSLSQLSRPSLPSSQPPPFIPGSLFRATSGTLSPMPPPRGSYGVQSELAPRAPAPHLQLRLPRAHSMPPGNQLQLPRTQPALAASSSPPDSHLAPLATEAAMSTLHSVPPSTSLPSSSNPSHLAQRASSPAPNPNPALHAAASPGLKIATPSITAGMQPPDSTKLSLDAWLTASLGLSGDASRATATAPATNVPEVDVVCLSDDE